MYDTRGGQGLKPHGIGKEIPNNAIRGVIKKFVH